MSGEVDPAARGKKWAGECEGSEGSEGLQGSREDCHVVLTPVCFLTEFQSPIGISSSCNVTRTRVVGCGLVGVGRLLGCSFPESLYQLEIMKFSAATWAHLTAAEIDTDKSK